MKRDRRKAGRADADDLEIARLSALDNLEEMTLRARLGRLFSRLAACGVWSYVAAIVALTCAVQFEGDRWWLATVIMFGPRWFSLLPLAILAPLALAVRPRLLIPLAIAAALATFGLIGLCIPWPWHQVSPVDHHPIISTVTCNIQGDPEATAELPQVITTTHANIVAIQEMGPADTNFLPENWHVAREGSLAIASPFPITDTEIWRREQPPSRWPPLVALYAIIDLPSGPVGVCNVHLTSPHHGLAQVLDRHTIVSPARSDRLTALNYWRFRESASLADWIRERPRIDLILGDFNMPVQSQIYRQCWSSYHNAFSRVGAGLGYTRWAQIQDLAFGVRIDHVLTTDRWRPLTCTVGPDVGSDHLPVLATVGQNDEYTKERRSTKYE